MTGQPAVFTSPADYSDHFATWVAGRYGTAPDDMLKARAEYLADSVADLSHHPAHDYAGAGKGRCYVCRLPVEAGTGAMVLLLGQGGAAGVDLHRTCGRLIAAEQDRLREHRP